MAPTDITLLETLLQEWQEQLSLWAQNGTLTLAAQEALQLEGTPERLRELVAEWSEGDFSNLPPVVLLAASAMPGAAGAYAISTGTIYLNQDWLATASKQRLISILTEELGHHLDGLLNTEDTPGDEGELFADLVHANGLTEVSLLAARHQVDAVTIIVNDEIIEVESASSSAIEALNKLLGIVGITPPGGNQYLAGQCVSFVKRYTQELGIFMGSMGPSSQNRAYDGGAECGFRNFNKPGNSLTAAQADRIVYTGSEVPQIGDIIFFDNSTWGHVAVIQNVLDNDRVVLQESNTDGRPAPQSRVVLREINLKTITSRGSVMGWFRLKNISIGGNPSLPPITNPSLTPTTTAQLPLLVGNLNGESQKDIIYRRPNGDVKGVLLDSEGTFNWAFRVGSADKSLPLVGIGDINGDGRDNVVFRTFNGDVTGFRANTSGAAYEYYKIGWANSSLPIIGISDITGNGRSEIIFRSSNGEVNAFRMGEDGVATEYYRVGWAAAEFPVVAIGDISGDGRSEILFRSGNGEVNAFRMQEDGIASQYYRVGWADPSIKLVGIGDITGDGRGEVIFRAPNGDVGAFLTDIDGVARLWYVVGWADPSLPIVGIGDTTGNGRSEIFFRQPNGHLGAFRINSAGIADLYYQTNVVDPAVIDLGYSTPTITAGLQTSDESDLGWRVLEGNSGLSQIIIDVSVDNASGDTVFVDYSTEDGTATAGSDYLPTSGTLVFAAGQKVKQVLVSIIGDSFSEANETFRFVLSNAVGGTINNRISEITILNDDTSNSPPTALALSTTSFNENIDAGYTIATLTTADPDAGDTFSYALVAGSGDTDNGAFSIAGNQLRIKASPDFETKSSYSLRIRSTDKGGLSIERIVILTVNNLNDGPATFAISGTRAVGQKLTAALATADPDGNRTFFHTWQASANGTSWTTIGTGAQLTIAQAQEGRQLRLLTTYTDGGGGAEEVITSAGTVPLAPSLAITPLLADKPEGDSSSTNVTFRVTRTGDLTLESTARWTITGSGDNPADAADFLNGRFPSGTVRFLAGQSARNITVRVAGDTTVEPDEQFTVSLSEPTGASIDPAFSTAIGTIRNDDAPPLPELAIAATDADKPEGFGGNIPFTFTVTRTGDTSAASSALWTVSGLGANPADAADFARGVLPSGTVRFRAGETSRTITVNVRADREQEADERFRVTLSDPTGATIRTARASGIIRNDDLIGTSAADTSAADTLVGTSRSEFIDGLAGQDTLTGGVGGDVFGFRFGQSRIRTPDRITDFRFGEDTIALLNGQGQLLPTPLAFYRAANNSTATTFAALADEVFADADGRTTGNQPLAANAAALVRSTNAAIAGTYLLINDGNAGRSLTSDLMVNITGFSGSLPALGVRPVESVFV